jgi:hypothetical protein
MSHFKNTIKRNYNAIQIKYQKLTLIDLSSQSAGAYFVYLKSGENVKVGKVPLTK